MQNNSKINLILKMIIKSGVELILVNIISKQIGVILPCCLSDRSKHTWLMFGDIEKRKVDNMNEVS